VIWILIMVYAIVTIFGLLILGAVVSGASGSGASDSEIPTAPNAVVGAIANAIATAEGYFTGSGSVPFDQNNPGDLTDYASLYGANDAGITIFPSIAAGWNALYEKVQNILSGNSDVYDASDSLETIGQTWADDAGEWASNVAASLGISTSDSLSDYAASQSGGDGD
jgi:hypothetical protein